MNDNPLLDVLTREGVLINVSVRYWRAAKKLKAEDLGLDPDDVTDRLISLGHKKLLPREAMAAFALIESRTHALVDANTFPFLNGLGHFLPNRRLEEVTSRLKALEHEFDAARAEFTSRYADLRVQASRDWWEAARKLVSDPDRLVATIEDAFPQPSRMDRYFGFTADLFQITVPERLQSELVDLADQTELVRARQQVAAEARAKISAGVECFVGDCVASMREQTAQLCNEMLGSFRDGKTGIHQKTLNRLVNFIDQFKSLNFAGDQDLERRLEEVRKQFLIHSAEEYRDNDKARSRLTQGIKNLADTAREMAQSDAREIVERFGKLGVRKFVLAA
ncbi:MAG: DUF3150 domain-containing protein [Chloroflexi bacterium]|nr:DUF3150 domain-containing protein [Chloroflexota bacterium]